MKALGSRQQAHLLTTRYHPAVTTGYHWAVGSRHRQAEGFPRHPYGAPAGITVQQAVGITRHHWAPSGITGQWAPHTTRHPCWALGHHRPLCIPTGQLWAPGTTRAPSTDLRKWVTLYGNINSLILYKPPPMQIFIYLFT